MRRGVQTWCRALGIFLGSILAASPHTAAASDLSPPETAARVLLVDTMEIGVTTGFYTHRVEEGVDIKQFSARPFLGYFLADRWVLVLGYDYEEVKRDKDVLRTHLMTLGPLYYIPLSGQVVSYFQGNIGSSRGVSRSGGTRKEDQGVAYDFGMGIKIMLWEASALDLGVRWVRVNEASDRDRIGLYVGGSFFAK